MINEYWTLSFKLMVEKNSKYKLTFQLFLVNLITRLKRCGKSYTSINKPFGLFSNLNILETEEIQVHCKAYAGFYRVDINENQLIYEYIYI